MTKSPSFSDSFFAEVGIGFFGALRPDHACQFVIDTHDHAYGLARAQSRARRDADSGSADLGPCRPTRSVVNVRVKSVVDCDHTADQLARDVGCAIGIVSYFATETGYVVQLAAAQAPPSKRVPKICEK